MTLDREQLSEKVARTLARLAHGDAWEFLDDDDRATVTAFYYQRADAILAVLPQYEQIGWDEAVLALNRGVPVYIVREADSTPPAEPEHVGNCPAWNGEACECGVEEPPACEAEDVSGAPASAVCLVCGHIHPSPRGCREGR